MVERIPVARAVVTNPRFVVRLHDVRPPGEDPSSAGSVQQHPRPAGREEPILGRHRTPGATPAPHIIHVWQLNLVAVTSSERPPLDPLVRRLAKMAWATSDLTRRGRCEGAGPRHTFGLVVAQPYSGEVS